MGIGSISMICSWIFHLSKLWKAKFFILCDVSVEAAGAIWNSWEWKNLWSMLLYCRHRCCCCCCQVLPMWENSASAWLKWTASTGLMSVRRTTSRATPRSRFTGEWRDANLGAGSILRDPGIMQNVPVMRGEPSLGGNRLSYPFITASSDATYPSERPWLFHAMWLR